MRYIVILLVVLCCFSANSQTIYRRGPLPFVLTSDSSLTNSYFYTGLNDSDGVSFTIIGTTLLGVKTSENLSSLQPQAAIYPTIGLKKGKLRAEAYIGINYRPRPDAVFERINPTGGVWQGPSVNEFRAQLGGVVNYNLGKHFDASAGLDKNFIGDGYYSLFLSDNASNNPFVKLAAHAGKLSYSILYSYYNNIDSYQRNNQFQTNKFASIHVLSYQPSSWLELQVYEAVIWQAKDSLNRRGFDVNYLNPVVFFRPIEFNTGSADNAMLGAGVAIKPSKNIKLYSQLLLDEFLLKELKAKNGWWANKFGIQAGAKWFNALGIRNLSFLGELNLVRPFTYTHQTNNINFGHNYASLAHPWGANFYQGVFLAQYVNQKHRFNLQFQAGRKGYDYSDSLSYGGDVFKPYALRVRDYQNTMAQGATTSIVNISLLYAYRLPKNNNLELFVNPGYHKFGSLSALEFKVGVRTPFFNSYTNY